MKVIRFFIFIVFLLVIGVGTYIYKTSSVPPFLSKLPGAEALAQLSANQNFRQTVSSAKIPQLPSNTAAQLQQFSSRATVVTEQAGSVLGTAVQQASQSGSIEDRAFEYARYLYCQQAVKDYEAKQK